MNLVLGVNSYVTLQEANSYFTMRSHASDWGDTSSASVTITFSGVPSVGGTITVGGVTLTFRLTEQDEFSVPVVSGDLSGTIKNLVRKLPETVYAEYTTGSSLKLIFGTAGVYGNGSVVTWSVIPGIRAGSSAAAENGSAAFAGGVSTKSDRDKMAALLMACRHIESKYSFKGQLSDPDQVLSWPRTGVSTKNGIRVPPTLIPQNLKYAQCELAAQWIVSDQLMPAATFMTRNDADSMKGGVKRIKLGNLEKEYQNDGSYLFALANGDAPSSKVYPFIDMLISEYVNTSFGGTNGRITI